MILYSTLSFTKFNKVFNMPVTTGYHVDWVAEFLHDFPHIDFKFETTNSTFDPSSKSYKESIVFLVGIPIAWCVLMLMLTSCCLCIQCCKETPTKKKRTTCLRLITALFIIFAIGCLAVGFFGNEEGNKGIQTTVDALQDTNDTLSGSLSTLTTLNRLTTDIEQRGIDSLKNVFNTRLSNPALRKEVLSLVEHMKNRSDMVRGDISTIKGEVSKVSLTEAIQRTKQVEFYRWLGTIVLFCWQIVVLLLYIMGTLKKSKYWIVWGITLGYVSLFLIWVATGAYLGGSVGMSDFCYDPNHYVIKQLGSRVPLDIVESYIECKNEQDPQNFSKSLTEALNYVKDANDTLTQAINKTLPYNITAYIKEPVRILRDDLKFAQGNITSLTDTVFCKHIHENYVKALTGVCNRTLVGVALILLILPIMGFCFIFVQCLSPRIWLLLGKRKGYRQVDSSDPFLPHPPPYNGYGALDDERASFNDAEYSVNTRDNSVMSDAPRPSSMTDSPPPAYHRVSSYSEQFNDLGTFPTRYSGVNHYATSQI